MKKFCFIFIALGSLMLVGAFHLYKSHVELNESGIKITGTVVDLLRERSSNDDSYLYYPMVSFKTPEGENIEFKNHIGSSPAPYNRGETVDVIYQPNKPYDAKIDSWMLWLGEMIIGGMGAILILIGSLTLLYKLRKQMNKQSLLSSGESVTAKVISVEQNTALKINGRSPYVISCQWNDKLNNAVYIFKSENIWFDPAEFVTQGTINVYIDRNNPEKKYYVDISFLPKI